MLYCLKGKTLSMPCIFWCDTYMEHHRIISASLSPNTQPDDIWRAVETLCSPWSWKFGSAEQNVRTWFSEQFGTDAVFTFNSGRTALFALLRAYGIGKGDEVIVQAFTCVAVPNSVLWAGAKPVYADIDASYNLSPSDIEKKITDKTKVIIIQHTIGIPAQIEKIMAVAKKYNLYVIEDCAHALGSMYKGKRLGTFGDAAFFSFGRDKSVSSVWGGAAILHTPTAAQKKNMRGFHDASPMPGARWIIQQLLHPIAFSIILPLYRIGVGKAILLGLQKLRLLSYPVYPEEKRGLRPKDFPGKYPNALARLVTLQLSKSDSYAANRIRVSTRYAAELPARYGSTLPGTVAGSAFLRYPIRVSNPDRILRYAKSQGILLGNWYHHVIDPKGVDFAAVGYKKGSCPNAETAAAQVINLPTRISECEADRVITCIKTYTE